MWSVSHTIITNSQFSIMGKDKFNPYNSSQYFNLPNPSPIYDPERTLMPKAGMSLGEIDELRRMKDRAAEIDRIGWEMSIDRRLHGSTKSSWEAGRSADEIMGHSDCAKGSGYDPS